MSYFHLSFAKRKYILNGTKFSVILVLVLVLLALDIVWLVKGAHSLSLKFWQGLPLLPTLISLVIILAIIWLFIWLMFQVDKRLDAKMEEYLTNYEDAYKGDKGEELVHQELQEVLNPQDYKIYRNTVLPGKKSDIDFIVVGPKGVIVLEIKNCDTKTIFTYDDAYYKSQAGNLIPLEKDYRGIVKWQATCLEKYLASQGFAVKVRKALVYLNPKSVEIRDGGRNRHGVYVAVGIGGLSKFVDDCFIDKKFTPDNCLKVSQSLQIKF